MLFHRDFIGYTGGHGKVWDYFNHALSLGWDARVYLTPESINEGNPWLALPDRVLQRWRPQADDVLFLAGMDWQALGGGTSSAPRAPQVECALDSTPVVNLVQHVRHAVNDPAVPLRDFLTNPAWRICVSSAVAQAIADTGLVNGPIRVIPAALNLPVMDASSAPRVDVFVGALKQPEFGMALGERLRSDGYSVDVAAVPLPRAEYLDRLAQARICVMLPHQTEGFYLPGLEAMALGRPVVMPDCVGNREYARAGINCVMTARDLDAVASAVGDLDCLSVSAELAVKGRATSARYTLDSEARAFADVLAEMELT